MKKNILICGIPNTVLRIFIETLQDQYTVYFLSYSKRGQYEEIQKILGKTAFLVETETRSVRKKLSNVLQLFFLSFHIASDKNTQLFVAYHNHPIKNGLLTILMKLCFPKISRIYFPYDIYVYQFPKELKYHYYFEKNQLKIKTKIHSWLTLFFDKICFELSHKIITKGFKDELFNLETVYKICGKPHFAFNFLIEKRDIVEKQILQQTGDITNLVSIGGISNSQTGDNNYTVFEEILKEKKIMLHVYSHSSEILQPLTNHKNLQIHHYITNHTDLINEISQYDFGISISSPPCHDCLQAKMASGVRIYDYLTAGLPIIIDAEHSAMIQIIKVNNFGIIIPLNDIRNIRTYIDNSDYKSLLLSVKKNREQFVINNHVNDVIAFLQDKNDFII